MATALARLGTRLALVVCSRDGLDEVSVSAPTQVRCVRDGSVIAWEWSPADFGLAPCSLADLYAESPEASARLILEALEGKAGPPYRVVLANAAAALLAAEQVTDPAAGVARAAAVIASGRARRVLDALRSAS